jgi:predicted anti-sigma-YlaC factor YlaD
MGRMEMNCSKALKIISLVIDREATDYQKRLLDFHLMGCPACRRAMDMSRDISQIARNLPSPSIPAELEKSVRDMLHSRSDITHSEHRLRGVFLALPAAAALLFFAFTVLPVTSTPESITEPGISSQYGSKSSDIQLSAKSGIRTAPLSEYSRQASLISF